MQRDTPVVFRHRATWTIDHTWDGQPIAVEEQATVHFSEAPGRARIEIDAPLYDDPRPPGAPGSQPGLFDYEVVELFLVGPGERYLEIEVGPHGHYWVLQLEGARRIVREGLALSLEVETDRNTMRWHAIGEFEASLLPVPLQRANAFAIQGVGAKRRYLAASPLPGAVPDFHRLAEFPPLS